MSFLQFFSMSGAQFYRGSSDQCLCFSEHVCDIPASTSSAVAEVWSRAFLKAEITDR